MFKEMPRSDAHFDGEFGWRRGHEGEIIRVGVGFGFACDFSRHKPLVIPTEGVRKEPVLLGSSFQPSPAFLADGLRKNDLRLR